MPAIEGPRPHIILATLLPALPFVRKELDNTLRMANESGGAECMSLVFGSVHESSVSYARSAAAEATSYPSQAFHIPFCPTQNMNNLRMHEIAHGKRELFRKIKEFHNWSILLFIDADVYIPWQHIKRHLGEVDENTYINFPYCPRTVQRVAKRQLGAFAIHRNCLTDRVVRCVYIAKIAKSGVLKTFYSDDCNLRNALIRAKRKGIIATDISSWHYGASLRRKPGGVMRYENGRVWHEAGDPQ